MRSFNIYGPSNPAEHYHIPRQPHLDRFVEQVAVGKYFSIYAPRQTGKTTFMQDALTRLRGRPELVVIADSFEGFGSATAAEFYSHVAQTLAEATPGVEAAPVETPVQFGNWLTAMGRQRPDLRWVLLADEFDGLATAHVPDFLHVLRRAYLTRAQNPNPLHSIALISLRSVADLNLGSGSPFNVAYKLTIPPFTLEEVTALLGQYTSESGQPFTSEALALIYRETGGHPFLVNRLAGLLTAEMNLAPPTPIAPEHVAEAVQRIAAERNDNLATLYKNANALRAGVLEVLFGDPVPFKLGDDTVYQMFLHGLVRDEGGVCVIANPIYQQALVSHLRPASADRQAAAIGNGIDFRRYVADGRLNLDAVLRDFAAFVERRGQIAFELTPEPREVIGQYLLMAYLDMLVQQIGAHSFVEVPTGPGRTDVIIVYRAQRFVVEMKIWRGPAYFDQGQVQVAEYAKSEGLSEAYFVVFHARPRAYGRLPYPETVFDTTIGGCAIHNYLVRLFPQDEN